MPDHRQGRLSFGVLALCVLLVSAFGRMPPGFAQATPEDDFADFGQGLMPDTADDLRNVPYTSEYRAFLPDRVDLSNWFPTPGAQGRQNSCVAWAVGYAARAYYASKIEARDVRDLGNIPSPAYIYNSIRETSKECLSGAKISSALNLLTRGAMSLKQVPYSPAICPRPSEALQALASDFRIARWLLVDPQSPDQIKGALAHGHPVIISFRTTKAFHRLKTGQVYRDPDQFLGYHAITLVGYDERRQAFKLINSWGPKWADGGFGWVDYDTLRSEVRAAYLMRIEITPGPQPIGPSAEVTPQPLPTPRPAPPPVVAPRPQPSSPPAVVMPLPAPAPQRPAPTPDDVGPVPPSPPLGPTPSPVLADLECSQIRVVEQGGRRMITGFVGKDEDVPVVRAAFKDSDVDIFVRPWPQCEALLTLDKSLARSDRPRVSITRPSGEALASGQPLVFEVETPSFPSYLHVAYIQADGTVLNLIQPTLGSLIAHPPRTKVMIGDGRSGGPKFNVTPPFGREMLIVLAGRSPIFSDQRPTQETERQFLTALRRALIAKPDPSSPDRDVTAGFDAIVTIEGRDQ